MTNASGGTQSDRVREIEMRLWEEVGTQLKGVTDAMKDLTHEMRDVRERLIRIEAQDQPKKIAALEVDLRAAYDDIARVEREAAHELTQAINAGAQDRQRIERAAADALSQAITQEANERARVEKEFADEKLALEKRLTRMEIIIAPLTMGGSALLAAVIGAIVTMFQGGLPAG